MGGGMHGKVFAPEKSHFKDQTISIQCLCKTNAKTNHCVFLTRKKLNFQL